MLSRSDLDLTQARPEWLPENRGLKADGYWLSDEQARAILRMSLRNLTGLDQDEIVKRIQSIDGDYCGFVRHPSQARACAPNH